MSSSLLPGARLGRYEIKSQLGAGGMGEVYLAHDAELDRTVAIKILPIGLASDQQRLQRFIQEAKAASALNHPHILTVYEIGTTDLSRFIATEFIEGDTLRQRIEAGLKLTDILEISIQAAGALAAAHAAGIIHRDIKPDNIMVRRDGYIKLLDFGLAKLAEPKGSTTDTEAPTKAMVNTDAGTVMGTANYMSPEQAKGTNLDARTDLWSLGAVLYEMVTGHLPFAGESSNETISLILQREPPPLTRYVGEVPAELERIVTKTLTNDREERYQTAKDLLIDLRNLKRKLEVDAEIDRTVPPELRGASTKSISARSSGSASATAPARATPTASSAEYIASGIKRHKIVAAAGILALIVGAVGLSLYLSARGNEGAIDSIAVLPFENQNHDANTDYLSDGVTESIINSLTQVPTLRVIARSSVFRYKGKETDPMATGKELGVRAVLTGRVMQRGDSLTISTELLDVRDNKQLWGEQYSAKFSDLLSMQRAIASQITSNLRLKLSGAEQSRVNKHYTENPDAYQLYLKGRFYWNKRTGEAFKKSIEYFNQAIERDPNYALAYAGLADSYNLIPYYSVGSPQDFYPKAKAAAKRALELDDTLAEAHTSLGYALFDYDWNFPEASREFQRAIELNPNYASAHQWYGRRRMMLTGRFDEAITEVKRALELDPLSLAISTDLGNTYIYARQYDRAIEQLRKTIDMDQNFYYAHWWLGTAYVMKGDFQNAIAEYQKARQLNDDPYVLGLLGHAYAVSGKRDEALKTLRQLKEIEKQRYVPAYSLALVYAGLGDKDEAFRWLERGYQERHWLMTRLKVDPLLDNLRSDPRFADLLRRVGMPQ